MRLIKILFWLAIMGAYWGATNYAPMELTRYILVYLHQYGQFPPGQTMTASQEIVLIWIGYGLSIVLVGLLAFYISFPIKKDPPK